MKQTTNKHGIAILNNPPAPAAVQLSLFGGGCHGFPLRDVLQAARLCLRGKENTWEARMFVYGWWSECVRLWRELNDQSYQVSRYIVFISFRPVVREIFGSAFRDRVVDTLLMMRLLPTLEQQFVTDNYSTRKDKGALFGVRRVAQMIYDESEGYIRDCWILKMDIQSFFMSLSKEIAYQMWDEFLHRNYYGDDIDLILLVIHRILFDRPELDCVRKGKLDNWLLLPRSKSLFASDGMHGLPIGKVISQVTALLYLDRIDHQITNLLGFRNGHYMDDRVIVSASLEKLKRVKLWLDHAHSGIELTTHPHKTILQHYTKGVLFAGAMIMPGRIYLSNRSVANCFDKLYRYNNSANHSKRFVGRHYGEFISTMNSYLGQMGHFAEHNTSHRIVAEIASAWYEVVEVVEKKGRFKVRPKTAYTPRALAKRHLRQRMNRYFKDKNYANDQGEVRLRAA